MRWLPGPAGGTEWRAALGSGIVTLVVVLVAGIVYTLASPPRSEAESRLAVFPSETDPGAQASYYETLSAGQIVQTISDLLDSRLSQDGPGGGDVAVHVVPNTSIIEITATAGSASEAEETADAALLDGLDHVSDLRIPFAATPVTGAEDAARAGVSRPVLLAGTVLAGLIAAVGVANAVAGLVRIRRRTTAPDR